MNKYIDADLLREKIAEQMESLPREVGRGAGTITSKGYGMMEAFQIVRSIIDSLQQEQQEVNFKIEERKWVHHAVDNVFPEDGDFMSEVDFRKILKDTARHFYELGLKAK